MRQACVVLISLLLGCVHPTERPHVSPPERRAAHLSAQIWVSRPNSAKSSTISPGDTLFGNDSFFVRAWADSLAYIYIVHYAPSGWSDLLFPTVPPQQISPGDAVRVPPSPEAFTLDDQPGDELIMILASEHPLDREMSARLRLPFPLVWLATRGGPGQLPPPPPPDGVPPNRRDGELLLVEQNKVLRQVADETGNALILFPFKHADPKIQRDRPERHEY